MNRDAYQTPPEVFAALNAEFNFKVDVASSADNKLCEIYIDEALNALQCDWLPDPDNGLTEWHFCWCNPPYSDISPWVAKAAEQATKGVGTVMLVMMDQSVGWYKEAIKTCQEVRLVIGGRLSFIDPSTGKPAAGNNKGSMFIIWHPFGRTKVQYSHIERDELLAAGRELLAQALPEQNELSGNPEELAATECVDQSGTDINDGTKSLTIHTVEYTSEEIADQLTSGKLPFTGDHLALMLQLDGMFGKHDSYTTSQIRAAILAFDEPGMVTKGGEVVAAVAQVDDTNVVELTEEQNDLFEHFDAAMTGTEPVSEQEAEPAPAPATVTNKDGKVVSDNARVFFDQLQIPQNIRAIGEECEVTEMWRSGHSIWGKRNFLPGKIDGIGIKTTGDFKKGYLYEPTLVVYHQGKEAGEYTSWPEALAALDALLKTEPEAEPETEQTHNWPVEVYTALGNALTKKPIKLTKPQRETVCRAINQKILNGGSKDEATSIAIELLQEYQSCAA